MKTWEVVVFNIMNAAAGKKTLIVEAADEKAAKRKALILVPDGVPGVLAVRARN